VKFRFISDKAKSFNVWFDDKGYKGSHAGHICQATISPTGVNLGDAKTGGFNLEGGLYDRKKANQLTDDEKKLLASKQKRIPAKLARGDWHTLVVTTSGDTISVSIDGKEVGSFRLDVLVNNAGAGLHIGPAEEQTDAAVVQSLAVNLTGAILGCRRAAAQMRRQGDGLIVNIGSACSTHAWPGWSVYSAAKAGLLQFSRCLLTELRPHGVRVTSLLPSWGQTDFTTAAGLPPRDPEVLARCISPGDLGRLVVDLARLPAHLVAEEIKLWPMVQPMAQL